MGEGFFDRNLRRLLGRARPVHARPLFREQLRRRLQDEAGAMRDDRVAASLVPDPASPETMARRPGLGAAAAAILVMAVGAWGVWRWVTSDDFGRDRGPIIVGQELVRRETPLVLQGAGGRRVLGVTRDGRGSAVLEERGKEVAQLELRHGAEVSLASGPVPELTLTDGVLRVETARPLRVRVATAVVSVGAGADVEIEHVMKSGDGTMNKSWLIPGGVAVAVGATAVAILLHKGNAEVKTPDSRPAPVAVEKPVVIELSASRPVNADEDREKRLAQAEWKIADLEKKLAAAKKESEKLARDLVEKKGVTIDQITARIAELRKGTGMAAFLPGKTAELIADLKGLGPEGTKALLDLLKSQDPKDRFIAGKLLEDLKDPASIPDLLNAALNDEDKMAANMAGHALALMENPKAIDALREVLAKKRSWESEVNALWGLTNLGDAQGLEQAIAYMSSDASNQARAALGANVAVFMHRPDVMPIVDRTVQDFHESRQVMEFAIDYYDTVDAPNAPNAIARDRLQAIANDTRLSQALRTMAQHALNQ